MDSFPWQGLVWLFLVSILTPLSTGFSIPRNGLLLALPTHHPWPIVCLVCVAGSLIGMSVFYFLAARLYTWGVVRRGLDHWLLRRLRRLIGSRLAPLIIVCNLVGIPDPVHGVTAGLTGYPYPRYLLVNAVGRFLHIAPWVLAGTYVQRFGWYVRAVEATYRAIGQASQAVWDWCLSPFGLVTLAVLAIVAVILILAASVYQTFRATSDEEPNDYGY